MKLFHEYHELLIFNLQKNYINYTYFKLLEKKINSFIGYSFENQYIIKILIQNKVEPYSEIKNSKYALYVTDKAKILKLIKTDRTIIDSTFLYKIGDLINIAFWKTYKVVYYQTINLKQYTGKYKWWYANGSLATYIYYKKGEIYYKSSLNLI